MPSGPRLHFSSGCLFGPLNPEGNGFAAASWASVLCPVICLVRAFCIPQSGCYPVSSLRLLCCTRPSLAMQPLPLPVGLAFPYTGGLLLAHICGVLIFIYFHVREGFATDFSRVFPPVFETSFFKDSIQDGVSVPNSRFLSLQQWAVFGRLISVGIQKCRLRNY